MSLSEDHAHLLEGQIVEDEGMQAAVLAICWPNASSLTPRLSIPLRAGETVDDAAAREALTWSPRWLTDAGYRPMDADGSLLVDDAPATVDGPCTWDPPVRLCRVDDQTSDTKGSKAVSRRLAGEVALSALWGDAAFAYGVPEDARPMKDLDGNTRGARFKNVLVHVLRRSLPTGWRVEPEVHLTRIRGLHMRRDVGDRRSDIVVIDEGNRLVAVISSKWTWRSDRGTEAAQMVPLMRYRPDVPYTMVTAEFPRARTVSRESVEDRAYHLCPDWVGAWQAVYASTESPRVAWPSLADLRRAGSIWSAAADLPGLATLVADLKASGTIL